MSLSPIHNSNSSCCRLEQTLKKKRELSEHKKLLVRELLSMRERVKELTADNEKATKKIEKYEKRELDRLERAERMEMLERTERVARKLQTQPLTSEGEKEKVSVILDNKDVSPENSYGSNDANVDSVLDELYNDDGSDDDDDSVSSGLSSLLDSSNDDDNDDLKAPSTTQPTIEEVKAVEDTSVSTSVNTSMATVATAPPLPKVFYGNLAARKLQHINQLKNQGSAIGSSPSSVPAKIMLPTNKDSRDDDFFKKESGPSVATMARLRAESKDPGMGEESVGSGGSDLSSLTGITQTKEEEKYHF